MVATTGDGCATRAGYAIVVAKPSRIVSGKWLLPAGH
jgi:hypothetical protein